MKKILHKHKKAFTLVELLVVITVLTILITIGFISFKGYVRDARDGGRVADISNITNGLEITNVKLGKYPDPDKKDGQSLLQTGALSISGSIIEYSYLGVVGDSVTRQLSLTKIPQDPLTGDKYIYTKTTDGRKYQIASILENPTSYKNNLVTQVNAGNDGYVAKVEGNHGDIVIQQTSSGKYITVVPSLVFDPSGSNILNQTGTLSIVNNKGNLPYSPSKSSNIGNTTTAEQLIREVRNNDLATTATLKLPDGVTLDGSGVLNEWWIPNKNGTNWNGYSSGVILASLGSVGVDGGADYTKLTAILNGWSVPETTTTQVTTTTTPSYDIGNSLRFNGSNQYLSRIFGNNGSGTTWTYSLWFKNSNPNLDQHLLGSYNGANNFEDFDINVGMLDFRYYNGSTFSRHLRASGLFRDPSKWYHLVLVFDTNNNTESDRIRFYVDGNRVNDLSIATYPTKGTSSYYINKSGFLTWIGRRIMAPQSEYLDGYLSEVNFIDGEALSSTSFGQFDSNGRWIPKSYTGSYGTNGFHLDFSSGANLGADSSGKGNNWTPNNFSSSYGDVLLVHADGENNTTIFTDSATNKIASVVGSAKISTSQNKFGGSSIYLQNTSTEDSIVFPDSPDWDFDSDFTIDAWVRFDNYNLYDPLLGTADNGSGNGGYWVELGTNRGLTVYNNGSEILTDNVINLTNLSNNTWHHVALVRSGMGTNNLKFYLNGSVAGQSTFVGTFNGGTQGLRIGDYSHGISGADSNFSGYIDELRITKGIARWTSSFTPPNTPHTSSSFNPDQMLDSPTNNFATLNTLDNAGSVFNGNLSFFNSSSSYAMAKGTIAIPNNIPVYWTVTANNNTGPGIQLGFGLASQTIIPSIQNGNGVGTRGVYASTQFSLALNGIVTQPFSGGGIISSGQVFQFAVNPVTGKVWVGRNNIYFDSLGGTTGDPSNDINPTFILDSKGLVPFVQAYNRNPGVTINFGQSEFAFEPPTGFKALSTKNITYPIENPKQYFDVLTYTGNGATQSLTGLNFQPDLVWIKSRSINFSHDIFDSVRGNTSIIHSDRTSAENLNGSPSNQFNSFNTNGFTITNAAAYELNNSSHTYVAWNWRAGGTSTTNNDGTIQSQVSVNKEAGFSIVKFTKNLSTITVGHGLQSVPKFIITKQTNNNFGSSWWVYHQDLGAGKLSWLNTTDASGNNANAWNNTSPNSSVFSLGSVADNYDYIAYVWSEIPGYSKFGSYTGNGSADGPFIYTGFKPRWIMIKASSGTTGSWFIVDTVRGSINPVANSSPDDVLIAESSSSEAGLNGAWAFDILSNGFKIRNNSNGLNLSSSVTYIYAAFAELPFK